MNLENTIASLMKVENSVIDIQNRVSRAIENLLKSNQETKGLSLKDFEAILEAIPKKKTEETCNSWGCVTPHVHTVVDVDILLGRVREYFK